MCLLRPAGALKENGRVGAEFTNYLTAGAAGRAGNTVIVGHGYRANLNLWSQLCDRGENGCALGTVRHSIGGILDIASGENFSVRQKYRGANVEV